MVEFAAIIVLRDHLKKVWKSKPCLKDTCGKVKSIKVKPSSLQRKLSSKDGQIHGTNTGLKTSEIDAYIKSIDNLTCVIFLITYLVFNCTYWIFYLDKN